MAETNQTPDYKSTIRLPVTDFPMKGNLPQKEPEIIKMWDEKKIYQRVLDKNKGKTKFVLMDGPPYANGDIHLGHALNKTLKDIIIKYKNLKGFYSPFIPGWDCHGLPIEHKVMKGLMEKKQTKTDHEILALCRAEASSWIAKQKTQFHRLGIHADWQNPYITMDAAYEAEEIREFARAFEKGLIYRGEKPVYWNWTLRTALADAEIEYHPHKSPSVYVKFNVTEPASRAKFSKATKKQNLSYVIWTTTPWTLPANLGISLHPDFEYGVYDTGSDYLVIAKGLKDSFEKETGLSLSEVQILKGQELENTHADHPWIPRKSLVMLGQHVSLDAGTGAVHTAPGHGADDYKVGLRYGLPILCPVDENGKLTEESLTPEVVGLNIFKANPMIIEKLKASGHLIKMTEIEHSYPHCWRTKTPLIFRATAQWFLGIDLEGSELRQKVLNEMKSIRFVPNWGEARFKAMMENRPDWCLSRQRIWGVPIPIYYCKVTGEPLLNAKIMMKVADLVQNKGGIEAFTATPPEEVIGNFTPMAPAHLSATDAKKFGSEGFKHGKDILDVWFDSGIGHAAVQKKRPEMSFPADLYLEGSDQHRGWFNTSLLSSMATNEKTPFKTLLTHGFTLDSKGRKMSKSLGNVIDPNEVSSKSGSEIIRLWTAYEDYGQDVSCGPEELTRVTETYRRIRNTMRFLLGAIGDFDSKKDSVKYEQMTELDQWALNEYNELVEKVTEAYDNYELYKVYHALNTFFTVTLSATYLDVLKDRLYTWKPDGVPRRSSQTVLHIMTDGLIRIMAPILSFLAEESYGYMKNKTEDSVFLLSFPEAQSQWKNEKLKLKFAELLKARSEVQKSLEFLRTEKTIGASLEAHVTLTAEKDLFQNLKNFPGLREFLIVSSVELKEGSFAVQSRKADGEKCVRCWTYSTKISPAGSKFPALCEKCVEALS